MGLHCVRRGFRKRVFWHILRTLAWVVAGMLWAYGGIGKAKMPQSGDIKVLKRDKCKKVHH